MDYVSIDMAKEKGIAAFWSKKDPACGHVGCILLLNILCINPLPDRFPFVYIFFYYTLMYQCSTYNNLHGEHDHKILVFSIFKIFTIFKSFVSF